MHVYGHVYFDEGHLLRNYGSQQHMAASLLPKMTTVLFTGTPLYNSMGDFRAYMFILDRNFTSSEELIQSNLVGKKDDCDEKWTIHSQFVDRGPDGKVLFARLLRNNYAEFGSLLQKIRTYTIEK
ncbi:hypothetical protein DHEL01_v203266 [Diaporthe helianthi]|uniref:Helicase ATP-binding domain-containing protein n=1 Tax=Diaporthe helianthi TaxID=158607 RepID=A0A2P5I765_DIAHE|nr:hypothetical protein DHEL01_v203266 [Diaporthe helianthi]